MLFDSEGHLLASSDASDADRLGEIIASESVATALGGEESVSTTYSQRMQAEVVDVAVPVYSPEGELLGVLRVSHDMGTVYARFLQLRYLIGLFLIAALALSLLLGWGVANHMERPLRRVTVAIHELSLGWDLPPLPEEGPAELAMLAGSVNALVAQLHALDQSRRQLLANLVHELGRPLGALSAAIQALLVGADQDLILRRQLLAGMDGEVGRLRRLLDDLSGLYDQVLGSHRLNLRSTPLSEWLPALLAPWREEALSQGLEWSATVPRDLPTVSIDPDRMGQALANLLSNAIKFTPAGGRVSVNAGATADHVWVAVRDTGTGMSAEEISHLYTPYYRGGSGRRFAQGMGLGLTISRDLIQAHGGRIDVESTPKVGSCFTVWLRSMLCRGRPRTQRRPPTNAVRPLSCPSCRPANLAGRSVPWLRYPNAAPALSSS
jgi:signal transduction histidine kinase